MSPNSSSVTVAEPEKNGEAISFLGQIFFRPEDDESTFLHKDSLLLEAKTIYQTQTTDLNSIIWYGRRLAAMYKFRDAISIFSSGFVSNADSLPSSIELYGISNWMMIHDHKGEASIIRRRIISSGDWTNIGYIAAEADSSRMLVQ